MKKAYKILTLLIIIEFLIVSFLQKENFHIKTWFGNILGAIVFLIPIQALILFLSKEEKFSETKKKFFNILFWYINFCLGAGGIVTLILGK